MEDKQQLILYQLYEQFIFLCTLYADTIEVDLSTINNEYTIALLEAILDEGLAWFRADPEAPDLVFGNLNKGRLSVRYGSKKIDEILDD